MVAPANLGFETLSAPALADSWIFTFVSAHNQQANYINKGLSLASLSLSAGVYELPHWLAITCPTANRTAQSGPTTVNANLGADTARRFSRDGVANGILVEPTMTNEWNISDLSTWSTYTMTTANVIGPAGDLGPYSHEDDDGAAVEIALQNFMLAIDTYTLSLWAQSLTGGLTGNGAFWSQRDGLIKSITTLVDTWTLFDVTALTTTSGILAASVRAASTASETNIIYSYGVGCPVT